MHIRINDRFRPFTRKPGTLLLIPGTSLGVKIYPAKLFFFELDSKTPNPLFEMDLNFEGIASRFLALADLERGRIQVQFNTSQGERVVYRLLREENKILFVFDKKPSSLTLWLNKNPTIEEEFFVLPYSPKGEQIPVKERLSLGVNKAQDFDKIKERSSLKELIPLWFFLGSLTPRGKDPLQSFSKKEELEDFLEKTLQLEFSGILAPDASKTSYLAPHNKPLEHSPFSILNEGYLLIKSLFIQETEDTLFILPHLPPFCKTGRLKAALTNGFIELEWRKHKVLKLIYHSFEDQKLNLKMGTLIKQCRFSDSKESKINITNFLNISFKKGHSYYFDKFII
ncbi:hypothetical protein [Criblamydia sequanensis]|uniref:Uncharacterized protein n=1 Tax=Candidatus Criblamydia sequanensis CRIB-18 TaxID=1437425 RepID=A0A090D358_9BACT|nr:hypothetical protein [Criblamydia sequanensis]CDR34963.1 Conserved hypothetical protein [Criblamydia sequanensis CRIB-18]